MNTVFLLFLILQDGNWTDTILPVSDSFLPDIEQYLPSTPLNALQEGLFLKVPVLTGITSSEGDISLSNITINCVILNCIDSHKLLNVFANCLAAVGCSFRSALLDLLTPTYYQCFGIEKFSTFTSLPII